MREILDDVVTLLAAVESLHETREFLDDVEVSHAVAVKSHHETREILDEMKRLVAVEILDGMAGSFAETVETPSCGSP